jgi:hypothetical protein
MEQVLIILSALTLILTASIGTAENTGMHLIFPGVSL